MDPSMITRTVGRPSAARGVRISTGKLTIHSASQGHDCEPYPRPTGGEDDPRVWLTNSRSSTRTYILRLLVVTVSRHDHMWGAHFGMAIRRPYTTERYYTASHYLEISVRNPCGRLSLLTCTGPRRWHMQINMAKGTVHPAR